MEQPKPNAITPLMWHALAGASLGLCLGLLLGMTTAPAVGTIIGAIAALFATFFSADNDTKRFARVGGFGICCVVGVIVGVSLRAKNLLGVTAKQDVAGWVAAGFDSAQARNIVMYKQLGLIQDSLGYLLETERSKKQAVELGSTLSASGVRGERCESTSPEKFDNDPAKILRSYRAIGFGWDTLAVAIEDVPKDAQLRALTAAWRLACRGDNR